MKIFNFVFLYVLFGGIGFSHAQEPQNLAENETVQVAFAERVVMIEVARGLSKSLREVRDKCSYFCHESSAIDLGLALIGICDSNSCSDALVRLLGLRIDAEPSEFLQCQITLRGPSLMPYLKKLDGRDIKERCKAKFIELKKRELAQVFDVQYEDICISEEKINKSRDDLIEAIKAGRKCE